MYKSKINLSVESKSIFLACVQCNFACAIGCTGACINSCFHVCYYDCSGSIGPLSLSQQNK